MKRWYDIWILLGIVFGSWQLLSLLLGTDVLPAPLATLLHLVSIAGTQGFWKDVRATGHALLISLVISGVGGLVIGFWLGMSKLAGDVAEPILVALYSLPKVTLYPVILLFFGLGLSAKVAFGALHGIVPILIFTMNSVRTTKPVLVKAARVMHLTPIETARRVLLPTALPEIVSGLRIGFALCLLGVLLGEMFASQAGLGHLLMTSMELLDNRTLMAVAVLLATFALSVSSVLLAIDRRLHRSRPSPNANH